MAFDTKNIRNIALLGHSGSGKTTLNEAMLFEAGAISRRGSIEGGNTVSDFTAMEKERGTSLYSTLMHIPWKDSKINIIDTPGYDDFISEVISALKVADTGVMVLNACNGVEVGTELIWEYIEQFETPAILVINQLDNDKSDFEATLEQAINRFGSKVLPVQFPLETGGAFNAIVDALRMVMYVFPDEGGKPEKHPIPESQIHRAQEMHNVLVEAAAENDETLMEHFFDAGSLTEEELAEGLTIALARQEIFPVFCASGATNMGSGRIMGFLNDIAPSPADRPPARLQDDSRLTCSTEGIPSLFIYKTISEPNVGMLSYFKVYSGIVKTGDELSNAQNRSHERINQLFLTNGHERDLTSEVRAGDLGVTVKLKNSHTNNTLNGKGTDRAIRQMHFPEPKIRVAVKPPGKNDMEKLMKALHAIEEEDPTLAVEQNAVLKQTILSGQGQLHLDLVAHRVHQMTGIEMEFAPPRIPYRETITAMAEGSYRHKKQTGGAGQFAEVHMRIEPWHEGMPDPDGLTVRNKEVEELPWGGKLAFYWCIVGGSIDAKYSNAIKKGILQKMEAGPLTSSNCQDIRVCIFDGKMHPVDSNDMAFMLASTHVFKENFRNASPQIMEPIYTLDILCSGDVMGEVMSDLQTRRALIQGMNAEGHYQKITAQVPLAELYKYSSALRSLSQGRAKFSQSFLEYRPLPIHLQDELVKSTEEAGEHD